MAVITSNRRPVTAGRSPVPQVPITEYRHPVSTPEATRSIAPGGIGNAELRVRKNVHGFPDKRARPAAGVEPGCRAGALDVHEVQDLVVDIIIVRDGLSYPEVVLICVVRGGVVRVLHTCWYLCSETTQAFAAQG